MSRQLQSQQTGHVRMNLVGDVMLGRSPKMFFGNPDLNIWGDTRGIFREQDVNVINLETPIVAEMDPWPGKAVTYGMPQEHAAVLQGIRPAFANIANNHILDQRHAGAATTVRALDDMGILHAGVATTVEGAMEEKVLERGERTFVFITAADYPRNWDIRRRARFGKYGVWQFHAGAKGDLELIARVKQLRLKYPAAVLVLSVHWGSNWVKGFVAPQETRELARNLVRAGVDIIHGTSSHHIMPVEQIEVGGRRGIVFYGLGEFIDDYGTEEEYRSNLGMLGQVSVPPQGPPELVGVLPVKITSVRGRRGHRVGRQVNLVPQQTEPYSDYQFVQRVANMRPVYAANA